MQHQSVASIIKKQLEYITKDHTAMHTVTVLFFKLKMALFFSFLVV